MNTQLIEQQVEATGPRPRSRRVHSPLRSTPVAYRQASAGDAPAIHALIAGHLEEGRLLPRAIGELAIHADRFIVAIRRSRIVGCAELAPLSGRVAEIRSLVVDGSARSLGIGRKIIEKLQHRAQLDGFDQLCAFAHDAAYFVRLGFSIVPHTWVPEKIARDCTSCAQFRRCGQHALVRPVGGAAVRSNSTFVPLPALRG
ncbi:MAG: GNAT family N-acetyltransferase [Planctomycetota bacterium]|nr:GNAT family N-acetyltransferase [Planctomycetota bacterium]